MRVDPARGARRSPLIVLLGIVLLLAGGAGQSLAATKSAQKRVPFNPGKITGQVLDANSIKYCKKPTASVTFGSDFELSGPLSAFGLPSAQGVELAVDQINAKGGFMVGKTCYKINLVQQDNRSDAATAVAQVRGLVNDDNSRVIFGPSVGSLAALTAQVTQAPDPPAINFSGGGLWQLNGLIGTQKYRGLFKTSVDQNVVAFDYAQAIRKAYPNAKTVYILFRNDSTGAAINKTILTSLDRVHLKVVGDDLYQPGTTDFSSFISRAQAANPDVFYYGYIPTEDLTITRQLVQLGLKTDLAVWQGQISMPIKDAVGKIIPNDFLAMYDGIELDNPLLASTKVFKKQFAAKYSITGNSGFALWQYDYVYMTVKAMQNAKTVSNTDAVRSQMLKIRWNGPQGPICWNKDQNIVTGVDTALVVPGHPPKWNLVPFDVHQCRPQK